jgi:surface carbohydrate biosynthesis protein
MIETGKKVVLFPVETVVRELDFRLMLAALCARPDTQIVIGRQHLLQLLLFRLRGGLFVGKNLATWKSAQEYLNYKERNFRTVYLHEEGGIFQGGPDHWAEIVRGQLEVEKIQPEDHVCCWGEFQADCYRKLHPRCGPHIVATGHPRFNLCSPRYRAFYDAEVQALKKRHGKFFLINTNILWTNAHGMDFNFRWHGLKPENPEDQDRRNFYLDQVCTSTIKWARFLQLANHLVNQFPDYNIVVRPHPAEDIRYYTRLLQHIPRVTVTREGGVQPWLLACEAMIHEGCTTAIEAYMAGARVVNYRPIRDERFETTLPNLVGVDCETEAQVETALRQLLQNRDSIPTVTPENAARVRSMIDNFGTSEDAFEKLSRIIHGVLDEIEPTQVTGVLPVMGRQRLKDAMLRLMQPLNPAGWQRRLGKRDRGFNKFPPVKRREIEDKVRRIRQITGRPVVVRFHSSHLFSMGLRP